MGERNERKNVEAPPNRPPSRPRCLVSRASCVREKRAHETPPIMKSAKNSCGVLDFFAMVNCWHRRQTISSVPEATGARAWTGFVR